MSAYERFQFVKKAGPKPDCGLRIYSPKAGQTIRFIAAGDHYTAHLVHWNGTRTVPHLRGKCPYCGCPNVRTPQLRGYLAAGIYGKRGVSLIELTHGACNQWDQLRQSNPIMMGFTFQVGRPSGGKTGRIVVTRMDYPRIDLSKIPQFTDVEGELMRKWNITEDILDADPDDVFIV
jgi:hypothetical protein